jgi:hypothetical protein
LLAAYCFERGKALPRNGVQQRWYRRSAAAFGLMMASKYMPGYFGVHSLFNVAAERNPSDKTPDKNCSFHIVMAVVFVCANLPIVAPSTWRYLVSYVRGDTLRHTGYFFAGRIYVNTVPATPWGLPWTFYLKFFATKVPLGVLVAAAIGVVWAVRNSSHRGATFIRVFLVFTLLPYSLFASKFLRYMLPALAVVDIAAAVGLAWVVRRINDLRTGSWRHVLTAGCAACVVVPSVVQQISVMPYYGLAQNVIGAQLVPRGSMFPDDELYDAGMREAVAAIASAASKNAVVCSDAPAVVEEYLARTGRRDVRSCSISHDGLPMQPVETWVIAEDSHTYFENITVVEDLRRRLKPWLEVRAAGVPAVTVFRFR